MFCIMWHLGGFRRLQNTRTGCGKRLPTFLLEKSVFVNFPVFMLAYVGENQCLHIYVYSLNGHMETVGMHI